MSIMTNEEFVQHLAALRLTFAEAATLLGVSERSARRWVEENSVPGPVEAAVRAWLRLDARHLPWKPDSVSIFDRDDDQIKRMREHNTMLDALMSAVEKRGGPATIWAVDLAKQRATFGPAEVGFYKLQNGGFSPATYRRADRRPSDDDLGEMQDACYCIAQAFARARAANKALIDIADYTRQHAGSSAQKGNQEITPSERKSRAAAITSLADDLNMLAGSALEGEGLYSEFEQILDSLHSLGFFPERNLVSAVARSMIGPPPRPDINQVLSGE